MARRSAESIERRRKTLGHIHAAARKFEDRLPEMVDGLIDDFEDDETDVKDRVRIFAMLSDKFAHTDQLREDLGLRSKEEDAALKAGLQGILMGFSLAERQRFSGLTGPERETIVLKLAGGDTAEVREYLRAVPVLENSPVEAEGS